MDLETEERLTKTILESASTESLLNRDDNVLPFGFYHPGTDGKLIWMCNEDAEGRITGVFSFDKGTHRENSSKYIEDMNDAIEIRDTLINEGWKRLEPPKITFSYAGTDKPLNRKQKRYLKRKIQHIDKKTNPYRTDKDDE